MDLTTALIVFAGGTCLLLWSANLFVKSAVFISAALKLSPLIIGSTFVAVGTSLPELAVSLTSIAGGDPGLAMGNLVGSNIINILLVFPISVLAGKLRIGTTKTPKTALVMLGATLAFTLLFLTGLTPVTGLLLLAGAAVFSLAEYIWGSAGARHEDRRQFLHPHKINSGGIIITTLLSLAGIFFGSLLVTSSVHALSAISGYSTTIIGLSLVAIATSLPEIMVSVISQKSHQAKLAAGNVIGSNIYNLLLIGGLTAFFSPPVTISPAILTVFITATSAFVWLMFRYRGRTVPVKAALILLACLLLYLYLEAS